MSTTDTDLDELLTIPQVAALAKVSEGFVRKAIHDDAQPLQAITLGRYLRVQASSYRAWLAWLAA